MIKYFQRYPSFQIQFTFQSHLFRSLGEKFVLYPPAEKDKLRLLNEVWKYVTKIENIEEYVNVFEVWANYISKCFTV